MQTKIAIVGTGIAGMACGHYLKDIAEITFYEKNTYAGGHTNTLLVDEDGRKIPIDTGFMVFNNVNYPLLTRLFAELDIPTSPTNMSFSVQYMPEGLQYSGSGLNGLFGQRKNLFSMSHIKMLKQIDRFNRLSPEILDNPAYSEYSLREYVVEMKYGDDMAWRYLVPMGAALWSAPMFKILNFPAQSFVRFFLNHGFLGLNTQHKWLTVTGGSRTYRDKIMAPFTRQTKLNEPVIAISRENGKAMVKTKNGSAEYDTVILASHADEALAILAQPTMEETQLLSNFQYQKNRVIVHTDESVMPSIRRLWSSWNCKVEEKKRETYSSVHYWMNSLQKVSDRKNYFVSLNARDSIDEKKIIQAMDYEHPLFDLPAIKAQEKLENLNVKGPVYFCGSYFRYGFHEDALNSSYQLCNKILPLHT